MSSGEEVGVDNKGVQKTGALKLISSDLLVNIFKFKLI